LPEANCTFLIEARNASGALTPSVGESWTVVTPGSPFAVTDNGDGTYTATSQLSGVWTDMSVSILLYRNSTWVNVTSTVILLDIGT
jgi:hypothetical protein